MKDLPELGGGRTFALTSYIDCQGKERPKFIMNRDGTMLLTNTFKGRKACELAAFAIDEMRSENSQS